CLSTVSALRIVLLGEDGAGKHSAGNTILGREAFVDHLSIKSVSSQCEKHEGTVEGRKISVINTPALFNTSRSEEELKAEIDQCVSLSTPGPHVFLLVVRVGRFTEEEKNAVKWIQENFGEEALKFTMVLFTGGLHPVEKKEKDTELQKLMEKCRAAYHVFRNNKKYDRVQVSELLEKIDRLVEQNGGQHYTNEMYHRKVREEEKRRRQNERNGKAELIIEKVGRVLLKLSEVILKALLAEICAIFRSALKGFGVGVVIIVVLSLIGTLTHSWTCFCFKALILWTGGTIGALIGLYSNNEMYR
ncbi:GTPase IMAP family member 4-like, partial [Colossoma macropomum]|uniref:GTPase IMAP family member 4-like n=1 Tax=Colossoma macropomum TaxID=42526 RepID=UPI0018654728